MDFLPGKGVLKEETFPNSRNPSQWWVCGEFWNLRGQHTPGVGMGVCGNPQNRCLTTTPSGEAAQTLMSATRGWTGRHERTFLQKVLT